MSIKSYRVYKDWLTILSFIVVIIIVLSVKRTEAGVSSKQDSPKCVRTVSSKSYTCHKYTTNTCFGSTLSYTDFSVKTGGGKGPHSSYIDMLQWDGLKRVPKCWRVLHPLLCTFYMPKCVSNDNETVTISYPAQDLCKKARQHCGVIEETLQYLPPLLQCEDDDLFMQNCDNEEAGRLTTNVTLDCEAPMIKVPENSLNLYKGFEPCAFECKDPLFTEEDHDYVRTIIKYLGIASSAFNGLVIATYVIDWRSARGYPSIIILYVNIAYLVATSGWMFQFFPNGKSDIVCRKDLTIRRSEPAGENVFCILVFIVIYYGKNVALAWLCVFAYVWNLTCNSVGRIQERVDKQYLYYHSVCWLVPALLTVCCVSMSIVDADSLSGICYIGHFTLYYRILFEIVPTFVFFIIMQYFMARGVFKLLSLSATDFISRSGRTFVKTKATRVVVFCIASSALVIGSTFLQITELQNQVVWKDSLRKNLLCKLGIMPNITTCDEPQKPNLNNVILNIALFFVGSILVSTWAWTAPSYRAWKRCIAKRFKSENSLEQHNPAKHKLISQAFAKRKQLDKTGRLSLNLGSTHEDPIGFNKLLDPNHLCQNTEDAEMQAHNHTNTELNEDISSEWAAALPHLVNRRNGIIPPHSSNSVSCVSEDSRRPSCDSSVSEIAMRQGHHDYKKHRKGWFPRRRSRSGRIWGWRRGNAGSSSSIESNTGSQILPAITALIAKRNHGGNEADMFSPLNNAPVIINKPVIVRELAVQTSFEKLPFLPSSQSNGKNCNLSNNLTSDKSTQCSLVSLHEKTTQTKKSMTKRRDKDGNERSDRRSHRSNDNNQPKADRDNTKDDREEDPVLKLLTPN